jgi:hypothetical protein
MCTVVGMKRVLVVRMRRLCGPHGFGQCVVRWHGPGGGTGRTGFQWQLLELDSESLLLEQSDHDDEELEEQEEEELDELERRRQLLEEEDEKRGRQLLLLLEEEDGQLEEEAKSGLGMGVWSLTQRRHLQPRPWWGLRRWLLLLLLEEEEEP